MHASPVSKPFPSTPGHPTACLLPSAEKETAVPH